MTFQPATEFFLLAHAYFHQDFKEIYPNLDDLIEDIALGFESYGSKAVLKTTLEEIVEELSDQEIIELWKKSDAEVQFVRGLELRQLLKAISTAL